MNKSETFLTVSIIPNQELYENAKFKFWNRVEKMDDCWLWGSSKTRDGYGLFHLGKGHCITSHRLSYIIHFGAIKAGLCVCHKCDVRNCVRPDHLWLGTQAENVRDMFTKGRDNICSGDKQFYSVHPERILRGESHGMAKLTEKDIVKIRSLYPILSQYKLADMYNVTRTMIGYIVRRDNWRHIKQPPSS